MASIIGRYTEMIELFSLQNIGHAISMLGMACVVLAYLFVERDWLDSKDVKFYVINLIGAILLLLSLLIHFNLGSFVIEIFWITISIMGIINHYKVKP
jgi:predicted membrane protein